MLLRSHHLKDGREFTPSKRTLKLLHVPSTTPRYTVYKIKSLGTRVIVSSFLRVSLHISVSTVSSLLVLRGVVSPADYICNFEKIPDYSRPGI